MNRTESDDSIGQNRSVSTSVIRDSGTKVELMFKAHGLKKNKGLMNRILTAIKKPHHPSKLLANGRFTRFDLKPTSIHFVLEVQTDKKKKKGNGNRVDTFVCEIRQFPTTINPDSAQFEVLVPASGECFICLSLIKVDNLAVNWKDFLDSNGTLDVKSI